VSLGVFIVCSLVTVAVIIIIIENLFWVSDIYCYFFGHTLKEESVDVSLPSPFGRGDHVFTARWKECSVCNYRESYGQEF